MRGAFYSCGQVWENQSREAFDSTKAELALTKVPRFRGLELFVRSGVAERDSFPRIEKNRNALRGTTETDLVLRAEARFECQITILKSVRQTVLSRG